MRKRIALIAVLFIVPALPATAAAHSRVGGHAKYHRRHHRAHKATFIGREYWPTLEEWLTPQEGHEIEEEVCTGLAEFAAEGGDAEPC